MDEIRRQAAVASVPGRDLGEVRRCAALEDASVGAAFMDDLDTRAPWEVASVEVEVTACVGEARR